METGVAARLAELLAAGDPRWRVPIEHHLVVESTNDLLKTRSRAAAPEWSVVIADQQTAGRGRQGRVWSSPPGSLAVSVLLRPGFSAGAFGLIPLAGGLAVAEAVAAFGLTARLKWPNDIMVGEKKLAGVLAEGLTGQDGHTTVVLGIGVNLNVESAAFPLEVRHVATSVWIETGNRVDRAALAAGTLTRLALWYDALARGDAGIVLDAWRALSLPWWDRTVTVDSAGEVIRGVMRNVDERGALLLEVDGERLIPILSGEVRELRLR